MPCEGEEAFKGSLADARFLNHRQCQIKEPTRLIGGVLVSFGSLGMRWCRVRMRRRSWYPLLTRAFLINCRVRSRRLRDWLKVYGFALQVEGALVPCENVEAFKASFVDARFLNQRPFQIKTHTRLTEGVCVDFGEYGVR